VLVRVCGVDRVVSILSVLGLILVGLHFGIPGVYFSYLRRQVNRSWNLHADPGYLPMVVVIVPTYNEEEMIVRKLDNLDEQTYPHDSLSIIVADDASEDKTRSLIDGWIQAHPKSHLTFMSQQKRTGKMPMVLSVLKKLDPKTELIILTDADAFWNKEAVSNGARYFADPIVGVVTGSIQYEEHGDSQEKTYRGFYNILRVAESKIFATPVHNGPFLAIRMSAFEKFGLPDFAGIDDSALGSFMAFAGLRAIQVDDVSVVEPSRGSLFRRKTRRANRLILNFSNTRKNAERLGLYKRTSFEQIWRMESWLHLFNPWLLLLGALLMAVDVVSGRGFRLALLSLTVGLVLFILPLYRTWIAQQFYLIVARLRSFVTHDITWRR